MFNTILQGITQGLSEFLPISSSGHLTLLQHFTGNNNLEANMTTDIALHFGTLIATCFFFRNDLIPYFTKAGWQDPKRRKIFWLVFIGSIPTALIGLGLKKKFEAMFESPLAVCVALFITGLLLLISEKLKKKNDHSIKSDQNNSNKESLPSPATDLKEANTDDLEVKNTQPTSDELSGLTYGKAIITGIAQGIACTPGISRSGSTIAAGLLLGLKGQEAARYSFLLMIPAVGGATLLEILKVAKAGLPEGLAISNLIVGCLVSMITGFLSLKFLVYIINKQKLAYFAYYLFAISIICFSLIKFAGM